MEAQELKVGDIDNLQSVEERIEKHSTTNGVGECRQWSGPVGKKGRARLSLKVRGKHRNMFAARIVYALAYGCVPEALHVCHTCDNPLCVNRSHLFLGTVRENMIDKTRKGRQAKGDTHFCKTSPELTVKGSAQGMSKLTEADIPSIRGLLEEGIAQRDIARRYGVSQRTIWDISHRRKWSHV